MKGRIPSVERRWKASTEEGVTMYKRAPVGECRPRPRPDVAARAGIRWRRCGARHRARVAAGRPRRNPALRAHGAARPVDRGGAATVAPGPARRRVRLGAGRPRAVALARPPGRPPVATAAGGSAPRRGALGLARAGGVRRRPGEPAPARGEARHVPRDRAALLARSPRRAHEPARRPALAAAFATLLHGGLLGGADHDGPRAPLHLVSHAYGIVGLTPLEDQQLAGLLTWVPLGTVYLGACLVLASRLVVPAADCPRDPAVRLAPARRGSIAGPRNRRRA